jgi:hypothetical protein
MKLDPKHDSVAAGLLAAVSTLIVIVWTASHFNLLNVHSTGLVYALTFAAAVGIGAWFLAKRSSRWTNVFGIIFAATVIALLIFELVTAMLRK